MRQSLELLGLLVVLLGLAPGSAQQQLPDWEQRPWELRPLKDISFLWHGYHIGEQCNSASHYYTLEPAPINACYPADAMSEQPHRYECSNPGGLNYQYNLHRSIYAKTDATCSTAPLAKQFVRKDTVCKKDPDSGAYLLASCSTISADLQAAGQVIVKAYTDATCQTGRSIYGTGMVKATLLNRCLPVFNPPSSGDNKDNVAYHRKLALLPGALRSASFSIEERKFSVKDARCKEAPIDTIVHSYDASSAKCKPDPLYTEQFYSFSVVVADQAAMATQRAAYWMLYA